MALQNTLFVGAHNLPAHPIQDSVLAVAMILYPPFLKRGITLMPSLILIPQWAKTDSIYLRPNR